jgi:aryl-alcohol dehydrogenase-like predicted oxidoreductase
MVWSPLAGGLLSGKYKAGAQQPRPAAAARASTSRR